MKRLLGLVALMVAILLPISVKAAFFEAVDNGAENISKERSVSNAYLAGQTVNVDGNVGKDLVAAGSNVNVNGKVEDDLIIAGSNLNIKNSVGGSARVAGSTIVVSDSINEDLFAAASDIVISEGAKVAGDFIFAAGRAEIRGEINGDIKAVGGDVVIYGKIKGNVLLRNVNKLVIKDSVEISGKVIYYSPNEATVENAAKVVGGIQYNKIDEQWNNWSKYAKKVTWGYSLYQILGTLLLLLLIIYFAPKVSKMITEEYFASALNGLGWGIITLIVLPVASLILIVPVAKISLIFMLFYFLYLTLASTLVSLVVGSWAWRNIMKTQEYHANWQSVILGVALTTLLSLIPIIGQFILFVLCVIAFGTLVKLTFTTLRR